MHFYLDIVWKRLRHSSRKMVLYNHFVEPVRNVTIHSYLVLYNSPLEYVCRNLFALHLSQPKDRMSSNRNYKQSAKELQSKYVTFIILSFTVECHRCILFLNITMYQCRKNHWLVIAESSLFSITSNEKYILKHLLPRRLMLIGILILV